MDCFKRVGIVIVLGLGLFAGCSKSSSTPAGGTAAGEPEAPPVVKETDPNSSPMARAAYDFLEAVLKGDTQRANAMLTPQGIQRMATTGVQFNPPGLQSAKFQLGEVRSLSEDQAVAQCVLTEELDGKPHSEEMCCLLRRVENTWRISGIAYGTAPNMPWTLTNFETGTNSAIPRQGMAGNQNGGQQMNAGGQANAQMPAPPNPPAPVGAAPGMPQVGPSNVNSPNGTAGLGMPAVGQPGGVQQRPAQLPPYTAQEPGSPDRR